ncbi:Protein Simiate [Thelohanellus kitauei]|uniref:Protein Simiate n=1 Tax=Thelohanellus kitauei TaxID=669202 RepID=A0A0C2JUU2_THEKT|nr:Protein Simiate [Thelohanellus kitauei]
MEEEPFEFLTYKNLYDIEHIKDTEGMIDLILYHQRNYVTVMVINPSCKLIQDEFDQIGDIYFTVGHSGQKRKLPSGRSKKGGTYTKKDTVICTVSMKDGRKFKIRSHVEAKLLQVNEDLCQNMESLKKVPQDGFIAIFLINKKYSPDN